MFSHWCEEGLESFCGGNIRLKPTSEIRRRARGELLQTSTATPNKYCFYRGLDDLDVTLKASNARLLQKDRYLVGT